MTRVPPGEGVIPLGELVEAVERTGYDGTYDVELFSMGATREEAAALLGLSAAGMRDLVGGLAGVQ
jgi:sugar phosphate isomerase/epimerase